MTPRIFTLFDTDSSLPFMTIVGVPFKVNAHLLAFVSVQFHPIFD